MSKDLVLAEKPSVGRELAGILNCTKKNGGYFEGPRYIVTWALGHLVTLAEPEDYNSKYKTWRQEDLPMIPQETKFIVIRKTAKQFNTVRSLVLRKDVDKIIIATDAGREGELVARLILEKIPVKKPMKRLWISSQTNKAIKEGFDKLKDSSSYDRLYQAALSRARADWLVGLNVTRAMTMKFNAQLSAGRVQTPTLAMIVQREEEIRKFRPREFWTLHARIDSVDFTHKNSKGAAVRVFEKEKADELYNSIKNLKGRVIKVIKEQKRELPPLLYDLTQLQRDANIRFGFPAKKTLDVMQILYERHKLITYPRTDSKHLTSDMVSTLPERLRGLKRTPYAEQAREILLKGVPSGNRIIDDKKVGDHHAVIPTEEQADLSVLNSEERRIFDMISSRFVEALSKPFIYEQTTVDLRIGNEFFTANRKVTVDKGWKKVNGSEDDNRGNVMEFVQGEETGIPEIVLKSGKTEPPSRYTEASLLGAMEHPGKFIDDDDLRDTADKTGGLGTPATRADIIEKLFNTFYIERRGNDIHPTSKGIQLIDLVPSDMKEAELTARWEQKLALIEKGKLSSQNFINEMIEFTKTIVSEVKKDDSEYKHDNMTREKCPDCGKFLLDVKGKRGKMLVCPDRDCGYRKSVSIISNARCPECRKKMEIRGDGDKKAFFCTCGYREKVSDFSKRKGEKVDKREVQKFLRNQDDDTGINNALAKQLEEWKNKK